MCSINPAHTSRVMLSAFTSDHRMTPEEFSDLFNDTLLKVEMTLNTISPLRWHVNDLPPMVAKRTRVPVHPQHPREKGAKLLPRKHTKTSKSK